jgi:tetratricopeptide (TPR) repeat protein
MRGRPFLLLALGLAGCARYVVKVDSDPAGAAITLGGDRNKGDRWSVPSDRLRRGDRRDLAGRSAHGHRVDRRPRRPRARAQGRRPRPGRRRPHRRRRGPAPVPVRPSATPGPDRPDHTGGPAAPSVDSMAQARSLADAGQTAYKLTEYDEAIAKFKQAYELVQNSKDPRAAEILSNLQYNLAVVYESSYEVTPDLERLRRARIMYKQFDEQMATLVTELVRHRRARRRPAPHPGPRRPHRRQAVSPATSAM